MTFIEIMALAKQAVLVLFFSLFCLVLVRTWRHPEFEELRMLPLKEVPDGDAQA